MHFTDTTFRMIQSLEKRGHMIRQVVNGGVVMFHRAGLVERGQSIAIANGMIREEITAIVRQLQDTIEWMDTLKQEEAFTAEERELAKKLKTVLLAEPAREEIILSENYRLLSEKEQEILNKFRADAARETFDQAVSESATPRKKPRHRNKKGA